MPDTIRIATFNCENLFSRPRALNAETWDENRDDLQDIQLLDNLIAKAIYTNADKQAMVEILERNRAKPPQNRAFKINEVRAKLFTVKNDQVVIRATGRDSWVGWIELTRDDFDGVTIQNTGRVIKAVDATIQLMVEVEDRPTMVRFNELVLSNELHMTPFPHCILVDGNDERGIDIGLFSRFPIRSLRSHMDDRDGDKQIFGRDCPEYEVILPDGKSLWILGNHLKSKGYGNAGDNNKKRKRQAIRVAELYQEARQRSELVVVAGDFNDTPTSEALKPLLQDTDLRDVMTHPSYVGLPGTFDTCTADDKIDYILLSPALWERVKRVDAERSGIYAPKALKKAGITIMPTVTSDENSASDHAAVWVELEL